MRMHVSGLLIGCLAAMSPAESWGQQPTPNHRDVAYDDDHESQKLDVYTIDSERPAPAMIYIHGGGWRAGSKNRIPGWLAKGLADQRFAVVSIEYRFTNVKPHPAQVHDCVRAVQFVRHTAKQWNIDPQRLGVTGGSAGGHLSLWLALHDDMADPDSDDPVRQQSSRVSCAISFAGPTDWSLLSDPELKHLHPAYRQLLGYEPGTDAAKMSDELKADVSPITHASKDDPPVLQVHGSADQIVPLRHANRLHERLQKLGVTSQLQTVPNASHSVAGAGPQVSDRAVAFVALHLLQAP